MTAAQVLDVATVLSILRAEHGIDLDPVAGPLRAADFQMIAEGIAGGANTYFLAMEVAIAMQERCGISAPR